MLCFNSFAHRIVPLSAAFALCASMGCGPSVAALVDRGELYKACEAAEDGDPRPVVDRLVEQAGVQVLITPWTAAQARSAAEITQPIPPGAPSWLALVLEINLGKQPSALAELNVEAPRLRMEGWTSRYASGVGDNYLLLTGKPMPPTRTSATVGDLVTWSWDALRGDPLAKDQLAKTIAPGETPQDIVDADRLRALLRPDCGATAGTRCRTVSLMVPAADVHADKPAAIALTIRYATADASTGSHCNEMEHIVVPLAPGSDLYHQLAATFPGRSLSLKEFRDRARVYKAQATDPFYEEQGSP